MKTPGRNIFVSLILGFGLILSGSSSSYAMSIAPQGDETVGYGMPQAYTGTIKNICSSLYNETPYCRVISGYEICNILIGSCIQDLTDTVSGKKWKFNSSLIALGEKYSKNTRSLDVFNDMIRLVVNAKQVYEKDQKIDTKIHDILKKLIATRLQLCELEDDEGESLFVCDGVFSGPWIDDSFSVTLKEKKKKQEATFSWNSQNTYYCQISNPFTSENQKPKFLSTPINVTGSGYVKSFTSNMINGQTFFAIRCYGLDGGYLDKTVLARKESSIQPPIVSLANPASVNCTKLGGTSQIKTDENGGQYGVCTKNGRSCEEWKLFNKECSLDAPSDKVPKVEFQASSSIVIKGQPITLMISATNSISCAIRQSINESGKEYRTIGAFSGTGTSGYFTGSLVATGTLFDKNVFAVNCSGFLDGQSVEKTITISGVEIAIEAGASPTNVKKGQPVTLKWSSTNSKYCKLFRVVDTKDIQIGSKYSSKGSLKTSDTGRSENDFKVQCCINDTQCKEAKITVYGDSSDSVITTKTKLTFDTVINSSFSPNRKLVNTSAMKAYAFQVSADVAGDAELKSVVLNISAAAKNRVTNIKIYDDSGMLRYDSGIGTYGDANTKIVFTNAEKIPASSKKIYIVELAIANVGTNENLSIKLVPGLDDNKLTRTVADSASATIWSDLSDTNHKTTPINNSDWFTGYTIRGLDSMSAITYSSD